MGGLYYLNAFVLIFFDENYLRIINPGIALIIFSGQLYYLEKIVRDRFSLAACIPVTLFLLTPLAIHNFASAFISSCFLMLLLKLLIQPFDSSLSRPYSTAFLKALMLSAILSIKNTYLVPLSLLLLMDVFSQLPRKKYFQLFRCGYQFEGLI